MSNTNSPPNTNQLHTNNTTTITTSISTSTRVGPGGTTTGSQACAACKYQRRKCAPDCPLAPHFPQHQHKHFLNVHKLFGVSNVVKVLKSVRSFEEETAMKSMIFHANVRANDPVGGCHRIICELERQIQQCEAELELVLRQLLICQEQNAERVMQNPNVCDYYYGRSGGNGDQHIQAAASSSSMVMNNGKQVFVEESEDIKPHLENFYEKETVLFESEQSIELRQFKRQ